MSIDPRLQATVEKELLNAEKFYDNLCRVGCWRFAAIIRNSRYCRGSVDKAFSLQGNTGRWIFDFWVYLVNSLPLFIPVTFVLIPGLFTALIGIVSATFSVVTKEPKIIEKTITVPTWYFFKTTKTISETIMVPVINAPDIKVATGVAVGIVIGGLLMVSCFLKWMFKIELRYRMNLIARSINNTK